MALTYSDYLVLPTLLDLQRPKSEPAEHDEMLFIVIHQTYELWFRLALHETDKLKRDLTANDLFGAISTSKRIRTIWKTVVQQIDILETMTPLSFASFRDRLDTASGLQSLQFRELEFVYGYKRAELARAGSPLPGFERLQRRLGERSVMDHLLDLLEARGVKVPAELRTRDVTLATEPNLALQDELLRVYHEMPELVILFESLMDFDEGFQEWRYRHVKLVERTIGAKLGTGGSAGVEFLKRSLFKPLFPDLWAVRYRM
jgi:tryptophan 2,3-dioxygenase